MSDPVAKTRAELIDSFADNTEGLITAEDLRNYVASVDLSAEGSKKAQLGDGSAISFPAADGNSGQTLVTNADGTTSWADAGAAAPTGWKYVGSEHDMAVSNGQVATYYQGGILIGVVDADGTNHGDALMGSTGGRITLVCPADSFVWSDVVLYVQSTDYGLNLRCATSPPQNFNDHNAYFTLEMPLSSDIYTAGWRYTGVTNDTIVGSGQIGISASTGVDSSGVNIGLLDAESADHTTFLQNSLGAKIRIRAYNGNTLIDWSDTVISAAGRSNDILLICGSTPPDLNGLECRVQFDMHAMDTTIQGKSNLGTLANPRGGHVFIKGGSSDSAGGASAGGVTIAGGNAGSGNAGGVSITSGTSDNGKAGVLIEGLQYPTADGTNGQFIKTDGAGHLSFADGGGGAGIGIYNGTDPEASDGQIWFRSDLYEFRVRANSQTWRLTVSPVDIV
jgi:hypothetical protein